MEIQRLFQPLSYLLEVPDMRHQLFLEVLHLKDCKKIGFVRVQECLIEFVNLPL